MSGVSKDKGKRREKRILKKTFLIRIGKQEKQNFTDYFFKSKLGKTYNDKIDPAKYYSYLKE
jgi:hypothetical protein